MDEGTIRMQAQMFALVAEMEAIKARIEGMKAENQQREVLGHRISYNENAFIVCQLELEELSMRLREEI